MFFIFDDQMIIEKWRYPGKFHEKYIYAALQGFKRKQFSKPKDDDYTITPTKSDL